MSALSHLKEAVSLAVESRLVSACFNGVSVSIRLKRRNPSWRDHLRKTNLRPPAQRRETDSLRFKVLA
jgi:hypothetical protein